jgi:hypothetical protein
MTAWKSLLVVCLTLAASTGWGASDAVLVTSRSCGAGAALETSGVPLLYRGQTYTLTSAWGVLEEESGICHEVFDPTSGKTMPARLAALDWAAGFALLETPGLAAEHDLDSFTSALPSAPQLDTVGFSAAGSKELRKGRVVASKSTRHHLPALPYSYEVLSDRIDRGFIGAPVYGKTLDGIVSGQWLELVAGTYSRIREWKTASNATPNHLFVIPMSLIRESLKAGLPKRVSFQPAASKLGDRLSIFIGKHKWEVTCPVGAGEPPLDGIGPIGGGEGVGVGGSMKGTETCTSRVEAQSAVPLETPSYFPAAFTADLEKHLPSGPLRLPFLTSRNAGGHFARVPFFTAPHFFNELARGKRQWVLLAESPAPLTGATPYENLALENAKLKSLLVDSYPLIAEREDDRDDYRFLYTHVVIVESLNWTLMKWTDYTGLYSKASMPDLAKEVPWKGGLLQAQLEAGFKKLERLYLATGGSL